MLDNAKGLFKLLLIPAVLAFLGFKIDSTLQERERAFDKVKFTEQVLSDAFDSHNADKAFALTKLIPYIVDDKVFADTLVELIKNHYLAEAANALLAGNDTVYQQISDAAKSFEINSVVDSLKKNPETSKAEEAGTYEKKGLEQIQRGNLAGAQQSFAKAEKTYPGFHSSHEISRLLQDKVEQVKVDGDTARAKEEVLQTVRRNYSWKMPMKKGM
jgi:hypothetical protein